MISQLSIPFRFKVGFVRYIQLNPIFGNYFHPNQTLSSSFTHIFFHMNFWNSHFEKTLTLVISLHSTRPTNTKLITNKTKCFILSKLLRPFRPTALIFTVFVVNLTRNYWRQAHSKDQKWNEGIMSEIF